MSAGRQSLQRHTDARASAPQLVYDEATMRILTPAFFALTLLSLTAGAEEERKVQHMPPGMAQKSQVKMVSLGDRVSRWKGHLHKAGTAAAKGIRKGADKTAKAVEKGSDKAAKGVGKAADKTGKAADKVADKTGKAVDKTATKTKQGVHKAADKVK
jgi:hypothetical protein